jgi:hypothetical protein
MVGAPQFGGEMGRLRVPPVLLAVAVDEATPPKPTSRAVLLPPRTKSNSY